MCIRDRLLTSERQGPLKAILFVTGMTLARLAQGVLFGLDIHRERRGWLLMCKNDRLL